jgi:porphobilinogen synthase
MMRSFPKTRLRRIRKNPFSRRLSQENTVTNNDLILPLFIMDGKSKDVPVTSMPGVKRQTVDSMLKTVEQAANLCIPAVVIFPIIDNKLKTSDGSAALDPEGLVPRAVAAIKKRFPEIGVITDIALDPYTDHGQDGVIDRNGYVLNDRTVEILTHQATVHADAGADVVAPSDMMDGRVKYIRAALEDRGFINTMILSYAAKYASAFYGPFRDAVGSGKALGKADKRTYQMDPANAAEAMHEIAMDIEEGADMVMIKPGLPYLDIIRMTKDRFGVPTLAYNVSGEFAMIKAAAATGWLDEKSCVLEMMMSFKRAGTDAVLTYHALDIAKWLKSP